MVTVVGDELEMPVSSAVRSNAVQVGLGFRCVLQVGLRFRVQVC